MNIKRQIRVVLCRLHGDNILLRKNTEIVKKAIETIPHVDLIYSRRSVKLNNIKKYHHNYDELSKIKKKTNKISIRHDADIVMIGEINIGINNIRNYSPKFMIWMFGPLYKLDSDTFSSGMYYTKRYKEHKNGYSIPFSIPFIYEPYLCKDNKMEQNFYDDFINFADKIRNHYSIFRDGTTSAPSAPATGFFAPRRIRSKNGFITGI